MRGTVILTNFEFSSTIIGKVSHLSGGFSGPWLEQVPGRSPLNIARRCTWPGVLPERETRLDHDACALIHF